MMDDIQKYKAVSDLWNAYRAVAPMPATENKAKSIGVAVMREL